MRRRKCRDQMGSEVGNVAKKSAAISARVGGARLYADRSTVVCLRDRERVAGAVARKDHDIQPSMAGNARENERKRTSEHIEKAKKLVYFSARIPLEIRNAIRSASVYRKNVGLIPASEQDITRVALTEWLERNQNAQNNRQ